MLKVVKIGAVAFVGLAGVKAATLLPGAEALEAALAVAERAGASVAEASGSPEPEVPWDGTGTVRRAMPATGIPGAPQPGPQDALPELLAAVAAEQDALAARAAELDLREAELELARAALVSQNRQLEALRGELARLLEQAQGGNEADIARLVKIYEAMKPAEAAAIMQEADLELAVLVLSAMAERSSGPIMAAMAPVRANAISRVILERSRLPGDREPVIVRLD